MSTNYIAEFYKTADHNYEDFFGSYVADEKMNKINKEIKSLNEQIDLKKEELSRLYTLRYNDKFTPIEGTFILSYMSLSVDVLRIVVLIFLVVLPLTKILLMVLLTL